MRATRNRQFPRPASMTEPVVRHEVWMVPTNRPARRLHGGIAIPAEAQALFRQASRDMDEAAGPKFSIVLERHTVETLAMRRGPGVIVYAAEKPAEIQPLPTTGADDSDEAHRRFTLEAIAKAFAVPLHMLSPSAFWMQRRRRARQRAAMEAEGLEVARHIGEVVNRLPYTLHETPGREPGRMPTLEALLSGTTSRHVILDEIGAAVEATRTPPPSSYERHMEAQPIYCEWEPGPDSLMGGAGTVDMSAVLIALFTIAAHHQGGLSAHARQMGEALGVPVPFTMADLSERAMAVGLTPALLWPWREVPGCRDEDLTTADGEQCSICDVFGDHAADCPVGILRRMATD